MDATGFSTRKAAVRPVSLSSPWSRAVLKRASLVTLAVLLALAGAVVCCRQIAGALTFPLTAHTLMSCALLVAVGVQLCRAQLIPRVPSNPRAAAWGGWIAGTLILVLWGWGLSVPGTPAAGLLSLWGPLLAEAAWSAGRARGSLVHAVPRGPRLYTSDDHDTPAELDTPIATAPAESVNQDPVPPLACSDAASTEPARNPLMVFQEVAVHEAAREDSDFANSAAAEARSSFATETVEDREHDEADLVEEEQGVWQRMTRRHDPVAGEMINGWLRIELAAGQRHATAHVAICPPLDAAPTCYVEQSDGPSAQIKVAQALPHGIRFEIKLDAESPRPVGIALEFAALQHDAEQCE